MNNMDTIINGIKYIIVDMTVIDSKNKVLSYNVFDEQYNHITNITCKDKVEFMSLFNNYLKQNK